MSILRSIVIAFVFVFSTLSFGQATILGKKKNDNGKMQKLNDGYSFVYPKCGSLTGEGTEVEDSSHLAIHSAKECAGDDKGTWTLAADYATPAISLDEYWLVARRTKEFLFESKITFLGQTVAIGEKVKPETDGLIDQKDQFNVTWIAIGRCGGKNLSAAYLDHLGKEGRERARKDHVIPQVFLDFVASFKCLKKEKVETSSDQKKNEGWIDLYIA